MEARIFILWLFWRCIYFRSFVSFTDAAETSEWIETGSHLFHLILFITLKPRQNGQHFRHFLDCILLSFHSHFNYISSSGSNWIQFTFGSANRLAPHRPKQALEQTVELFMIWDTHRVDSRLAPCQWETSLQSNAVSHWLGASLESALYSCDDTARRTWFGFPLIITLWLFLVGLLPSRHLAISRLLLHISSFLLPSSASLRCIITSGLLWISRLRSRTHLVLAASSRSPLQQIQINDELRQILYNDVTFSYEQHFPVHFLTRNLGI